MLDYILTIHLSGLIGLVAYYTIAAFVSLGYELIYLKRSAIYVETVPLGKYKRFTRIADPIIIFIAMVIAAAVAIYLNQ